MTTTHTTTHTLHIANARYTWGSLGFCRFIVDSGEFGITIDECARIAAVSTTPEEFETVWSEQAGWGDKLNAAA